MLLPGQKKRNLRAFNQPECRIQNVQCPWSLNTPEQWMSTYPKTSTTLCLHSSSASTSMLLSDRWLTHNLETISWVNATIYFLCDIESVRISLSGEQKVLTSLLSSYRMKASAASPHNHRCCCYPCQGPGASDGVAVRSWGRCSPPRRRCSNPAW